MVVKTTAHVLMGDCVLAEHHQGPGRDQGQVQPVQREGTLSGGHSSKATGESRLPLSNGCSGLLFYKGEDMADFCRPLHRMGIRILL